MTKLNSIERKKLREQVERDVFASVGSGEAISKPGMWRKYETSGLSRGGLNRWIDKVYREACLAEGVKIASGRVRSDRIAGTRHPTARAARALEKARSMDAPTVQAIPFLARFQENLAKLDTIMEVFASNKDGTPKNPRLVLEVVREIGSQLSRAARVQAVVEDRVRQEEFMSALVDIILQEPEDTRTRIVAKMQALRLRYATTGG